MEAKAAVEVKVKAEAEVEVKAAAEVEQEPDAKSKQAATPTQPELLNPPAVHLGHETTKEDGAEAALLTMPLEAVLELNGLAHLMPLMKGHFTVGYLTWVVRSHTQYYNPHTLPSTTPQVPGWASCGTFYACL